MTQKELEDKVSVRHANGYHTYEISIMYRGKEYKSKSHNSLAWDSLKNNSGFMTTKQALESFYNECKLRNLLP